MLLKLNSSHLLTKHVIRREGSWPYGLWRCKASVERNNPVNLCSDSLTAFHSPQCHPIVGM